MWSRSCLGHRSRVLSSLKQGLDLIIKYFVGTELGVANFLQRHFDWSANCLWYEQIPNARDPKRTMFFLGGKDSIIDANVSSPFHRTDASG